MNKKIGILTSGGNSSGMNNCVQSLVNLSLKNNIEPVIIYDGYKGILEQKFSDGLEYEIVHGIEHLGGTIIGSSRFPELKDLECQKKCAEILKKNNIDILVVIGGNGTYKGGEVLTKQGIKVIAIPGTIDNDVSSTDFTIGFFTTLNTISNAIMQLKDVGSSHSDIQIIEVMGRDCGDLARFASAANVVDLVIPSEQNLSIKEIAEILKKKLLLSSNLTVVVSENKYNLKELKDEVEQETKTNVKLTTLGYIQRGGIPHWMDALLANLFAQKAIELIKKDKISNSISLGVFNHEVLPMDLIEANKMKKRSWDKIDSFNKFLSNLS